MMDDKERDRGPEWENLDRRQQLWLLDQQEERLVETLRGRSREEVARSIGVGPAALSPAIILTTPYPPILLARLAYELDVPAATLHPIHEVPAPSEATFRTDPDLVTRLEGPIVQSGVRVPSHPIAEQVRMAISDGISRTDLARAAGVGYSSFSRYAKPRSATMDRSEADAMSRVLSARRVRRPAFSLEETGGGRIRIVIAARMRRHMAESILQAMGAQAILSPTSGPHPDAVALRIDIEVGADEAGRVSRILLPPPRPLRTGFLARLFKMR